MDPLLDEVARTVPGGEQRLATILDALAEAVTIRGADDRLIYANRAALDRMGLDSVEQMRDSDPHALMTGWEITGVQGDAIAMEDLPSVKVLRGGHAEPLLLRTISRESGQEAWALLKAAAIRDAGGNVEAAVTIIEDVTEERRAALRMEFLARAAHVLSSSLDYEQTLRNLSGLAVPQIADWCAVDLFALDGTRTSVAVAHSDPDKVALAKRLREIGPDELDPDRGLGLVRRTGEPVLYESIPDEMLAEAAVDEEHLTLLREVGMRSALCVPIVTRGTVTGALTMVNADSGRAFGGDDLAFAEQIAERAALAIENASLYTELSGIARTLQNSLLPDALPQIDGWELAVLYRPAGRGNQVGGDFYDFWEAGGEWMMMIGDVTGKGVDAAAVTSLVRHTAVTASDYEPGPVQVLRRVHSTLERQRTLSLCTALCLRFSGPRGTIAAGGHPLPLVVSGEGAFEIGRHGTLLGAFPESSWPETAFELRRGDTLVAFTDGVTDAVGERGERFGVERLREVLAGTYGLDAMDARARVAAALDAFQAGEQADDTALVIMRYVGGE